MAHYIFNVVDDDAEADAVLAVESSAPKDAAMMCAHGLVRCEEGTRQLRLWGTQAGTRFRLDPTCPSLATAVRPIVGVAPISNPRRRLCEFCASRDPHLAAKVLREEHEPAKFESQSMV